MQVSFADTDRFWGYLLSVYLMYIILGFIGTHHLIVLFHSLGTIITHEFWKFSSVKNKRLFLETDLLLLFKLGFKLDSSETLFFNDQLLFKIDNIRSSFLQISLQQYFFFLILALLFMSLEINRGEIRLDIILISTQNSFKNQIILKIDWMKIVECRI